MAKPPRPWTVTNHHRLEKLEENLWTLRGDVPGFPPAAGMDRRMSIVRLDDGRLVFHNAVPMDEATLAELRAWGTPSMLIVPHHLHAMDAHGFREKLGVKVFTNWKSSDKLKAVVQLDGTFDDLPKDPALSVFPLTGMKFGEAAFIVQSGPRKSVLVADVLSNSRPGSGFAGVMFRLLGFCGPEAKVAPLMRLRAISDQRGLKADLLRLAQTPGLSRLIPSHGEMVTDDPARAIRRAAEAGL